MRTPEHKLTGFDILFVRLVWVCECTHILR
jgi:hypothetical protein